MDNLEREINQRYIQKLLGHKGSKTTEIYTCLNKLARQRASTNIDLLSVIILRGAFVFSTKSENLSKNIFYVIDGQQRLPAFYIGLAGSYNGKELYFGLLSGWDKENFYLDFASSSDDLKKQVDVFPRRVKKENFFVFKT